MHLSKSLVVPHLLLAACADLPPASTCGGSIAVTDTYLEVSASLRQARWGADGQPTLGDRVAVDCAVFTIYRPDSSWQVAGRTPAYVDLEPGTYIIDAFSMEGEPGRASPAMTVSLDREPLAVDLPMCVELAGPWVCEEESGWVEVEARPDTACRVDLAGLGLVVDVDGMALSAEGREGAITPEGDRFELRSTDEAGSWTTCWR